MLHFIIGLFLFTGATFASDIVLSEDNSISFNQPVTDVYVAKKSLEIMKLHFSLPRSQPIYLVLDTPGGSVQAGNQFIDFVKSLNRPVHTVVIFAESMGYQITQELGTRYILPSGTLMSHRGAVSGLGGQVPGELNARLKMLEEILGGMNDRAAKRVKMSSEAYKAAIINELWTTGENAVKTNHADKVVNVSCDSSLEGGFSEDVATIFGPISVEYSKCPLISGPIGFKLGGKKLASNSQGARAAMGISRKVKLEF